MEGFADLLSDVFSESSVPSFSDGDLEFENLGFDEKTEEDKAENFTTNTDESLQEATAQSVAQFEKANVDSLFMTENDEEQSDDEDNEENFVRETPEDNDTSSEEEGSSSGEDVEVGTAEEAEDLLMSVSESEIFDEGRPAASECADNSKVSNKVHEAGSDEEELSYFSGIPEGGDEVMRKSAETDEDNPDKDEDSSDSESEVIKQEENLLLDETENPYKLDPVDDTLEFPLLSSQNLQDLINEVDGEEATDEITDFTGDEHQEAGESFADRPSDFSFGEYAEAEGKKPELNTSHMKQEACLEGDETETPWTEGAEDQDYDKEDDFLYSQDLEMNAVEIINLKQKNSEHVLVEKDESSSYSSSSDEEPPEGTSDELPDNTRAQGVENKKTVEDIHVDSSVGSSSWSSSDDSTMNDRANPADLRSDFDVLKSDALLSEYLFSTRDEEDPPSDLNQRPDQHVNCYSVVQREETKATSSYNQGSIDDSFFFNTGLDTSEVTEVRQLTDEEYEERRNMELMQERIEAFKRFYDNSDDENDRQQRQIKVQFCADPLSQIIHYETESSENDSSCSFTEEEEDEREEEEEEQEEEQEEEEEEEEEQEEEQEEEEEEEQEQDQDQKQQAEKQEKEDQEQDEQEEEEEQDEEKEQEEEEEQDEEKEQEEEEEEERDDLCFIETSDEEREPEETLLMKPVCDPETFLLLQSPSEVKDTQTSTKTHKGFSFLKLMMKLGVVTIMGLLMFWLISDQPDWIRDLFSV